MKTVPAQTFKARCVALLNEVEKKRTTILLTKRGKPMAKLVPVEYKSEDIFGFFVGRGSITGDIVCSVLSPEEWGNLG